MRTRTCAWHRRFSRAFFWARSRNCTATPSSRRCARCSAVCSRSTSCRPAHAPLPLPPLPMSRARFPSAFLVLSRAYKTSRVYSKMFLWNCELVVNPYVLRAALDSVARFVARSSWVMSSLRGAAVRCGARVNTALLRFGVRGCRRCSTTLRWISRPAPRARVREPPDVGDRILHVPRMCTERGVLFSAGRRRAVSESENRVVVGVA